MTSSTVQASQRIYARIAGLMYLLALGGSVFGFFFVRRQVIAPGDAAETARNIAASEPLFRLGVAVELGAFVSVALLAVALYVLLKPVSKPLSLLASLLWVGEAVILGIALTTSFATLRLLSGAEYLTAFDAAQLQAMAMLSMRAFFDMYNIALVFFGADSVIFSALLLISRYIPRMLAGFGVLASLSVLTAVFIVILFPGSALALGLGAVAPASIFIYELLAGFWLLFFGANVGSP